MTYGDAPSRESSRIFTRERRSVPARPPLSPKLSRSLFNRAVWVNKPVGFGGPEETVSGKPNHGIKGDDLIPTGGLPMG
jgi:hypothetical protein